MSVFYSGGPHRVPYGQSECTFGRFGWWGRAVRDAPLRAVQGFWSEMFVAWVGVGVAAALAISLDHLGLLSRVLAGLIAFIPGVLSALVLLALWGVTPWGRRSHWAFREVGGYSQDPTHYPTGFASDHSGLWVESRHWHTVRNLRCIVTDPLGVERSAGPWEPPPPHSGTTVVLDPGQTGGGFSYPSDFDAPWPFPGTYKVSWEMDAEDGTKPVIISRGKWRVTE